MKKTARLICLVICILMFLPGCTASETNSRKTLRVGMVIYTKDDAYLNATVDCVKSYFASAESEDFRIVMTVKNADWDQRKENEIVEEIIDAGCDVLLINLVDRTTPSTVIDLAKKNDIPIIFFNREPVREDLMSWDKLYYVGSDARQCGEIQGLMAADAIGSSTTADRNRDGKIQYVILQGETGHQDAIIRTDSVVDTLIDSGVELEKLSYQIADWNRAQAKNKMAQMISQYGNSIELVLANNDEMALGAIEAYQAANITQASWPLIYGTDGLTDALQAVQEGTMAGTVYNDKEGQADAIGRLAIALYRGDDLSEFDFEDSRYLMLDYRGITAENVGEYLKAE